jgi:hypothetical protein
MTIPDLAPSVPEPEPSPELPPTCCAYCGQPFAADEDRLVQMRDAAVVAAFHDRCHPHYRRSGCGRC